MDATARRIALTLLAGLLVACGSAAPGIARFDDETLLAERAEWRGDRTGRVYLRRYVQAVVDTAVDMRAAESALVLHTVITRFGGDASEERVRFVVPEDAALDAIDARILSPDAASRDLTTPTLARLTDADADAVRVDPSQRVDEAVFPRLADGEVLEIVAGWTVRGTLLSDARWLGAPDGPTHELLLRYDLPSDATGTFITVGPGAHTPVVTEKDGASIIALLERGLPARAPDAPSAHARYVTVQVAPKNYRTPIAGSWTEVAGPYVKGLLVPSAGLREGYEAPYVPTGAPRERAEAAYTWVRDRLQRDDALDARWDAAKPLVERVAGNDLDATDKVHLLHWLLDAADVPHVLAVARSRALPPVPEAFPTPRAFDTALIRVPSLDLWLDPACRACAPGEVRPALRGGQALTLPGSEPPSRLPE